MIIKGKNDRILYLHQKLTSDGLIYLSKEAKNLNVSERSIHRDISTLRNFFHSLGVENGSAMEVVYDKQLRGYYLKTEEAEDRLSEKEIFILCKILLESRSLKRSEMFPLIDKVLRRTGAAGKETTLRNLLANEKLHYIEPDHGVSLIDLLWEIEKAIKAQKELEIEYKEPGGCTVNQILEPVGILFSEFYFYLTAFPKEDKKQDPVIYRVDRICSAKMLPSHFKTPYKDRF